MEVVNLFVIFRACCASMLVVSLSASKIANYLDLLFGIGSGAGYIIFNFMATESGIDDIT